MSTKNSRLRTQLTFLACTVIAATGMATSIGGSREAEPAVEVCELQPMSSVPSTGWVAATAILISPNGHGSGAIISGDGWILTNYHVVEQEVQTAALTGDVASLEVQLADVDGDEVTPDPDRLTGVVYRVDPVHDLALVKIDWPSDRGSLPHYVVGSTPRAGEQVFAIGSAGATVPWAIREGNVAAVTRFPEGRTRTVVERARDGNRVSSDVRDRLRSRVVATTAAIAPGDSGGPLLNAHGELVGLTFGAPADPRAQLGYHIDASEIGRFVRELPTDIEAAPLDLWTLGVAGAGSWLSPVTVEPDGAAFAVAGHVVSLSSGFAEVVGRVSYINLNPSQDQPNKPVSPTGLWAVDAPEAAFVATLVLAERDDGVRAVGYADEFGTIVQIRIDGDGDGQAEGVWIRTDGGRWLFAAVEGAAPIFDLSQLTAAERARFEEIRTGREGAALMEALQ